MRSRVRIPTLRRTIPESHRTYILTDSRNTSIFLFVLSAHLLCRHSQVLPHVINVNRKVQGVSQSQTAANSDTKRKRKRTKLTCANQTINAREARTCNQSLFPERGDHSAKKNEKHEDKEQGKTLKHEAPRSINHKTTQNKTNTWTTALERSVA